MKLFVGLGNPGEKYAGHRHNVGFMAVERIAERQRFGPWKRKFSGLAADGEIAGEKVMVLKPDTYMNESGRSVGEAARFLKIDIADVVAFHDELDLAPGKLKVKTGGGNAGHNGLRSITQHVGNAFVRVRIGIGHPGAKELVHGWVLHDFSKADHVWLDPLLDAMADAAGRLVKDEQERFLTDVALALSPADRRSAEPRKQAAPTPSPKTAPAARHPAGERMGKRQSALAENLRQWMSGRPRKDSDD
jgi:PTH1 family peptidyl-tRNA hydrolase